MLTFGYQGAQIELEIILMTTRIWKALKVDAIELEINSLGTPTSRQAYRKVLIEYFSDHKSDLDEDSTKRLDTNPMRILDSKNPEMGNLISNAPLITDYLDTESEDHFATLTNSLQQHTIGFQLHQRLGRGLE